MVHHPGGERAEDLELLVPTVAVGDAALLAPPLEQDLADLRVELAAAAGERPVVAMDHADHRQEQRGAREGAEPWVVLERGQESAGLVGGATTDDGTVLFP